jgi:hypothetical protein
VLAVESIRSAQHSVLPHRLSESYNPSSDKFRLPDPQVKARTTRCLLQNHETEAIKDDFKHRVCEQIDLQPEGEGRFLVFTPFRFEDGDHFGIVLKQENGNWILTDEATTLMHLSYQMDEQDLEVGNRAEIIENSLHGFSVQNRDGELVIPVAEGRFGDALYIQAITRVNDISFLSRERVRSTFIEDFKALLRAKVPPDRLTFDWTSEQYDPHKKYPVDARINGMKRPLFVYALPNDERVSVATISLLTFERWKIPFQSMAVFEEQESIAAKHWQDSPTYARKHSLALKKTTKLESALISTAFCPKILNEPGHGSIIYLSFFFSRGW